MLKEKFLWKVDGISIGLICFGCIIALLQSPMDLERVDIDPDEVNSHAIEKWQ